MKTYSPVHIWNFFKTIFPSLANESKQFRSHGKNAISIWFDNSRPIIFTLTKHDWIIEPYFHKGDLK